MYLLQVFSKKEFLLEKEDNCKSVTSLFEAVNYLVAYHDETNQYLQIQLMKYQTMFDTFDAADFETKITQSTKQSLPTTQTSTAIEDLKVQEFPELETSPQKIAPKVEEDDTTLPKGQTEEVIIDKKDERSSEEEKVHVLVSEESPKKKIHQAEPDDDDEGWQKQEDVPKEAPQVEEKKPEEPPVEQSAGFRAL